AGRLVAGSHLREPGAAAVIANDLGWLTSKVFSPHLGSDIALAYLRGGEGRIGQRLRAVNLLARPATETLVEITSPHFLDPEGERLRG
ncbi:MAG: glycine cleavage T C-terminal barrel domain-containing protein, partial [Gemmobacter sp.]